MPAAPSSVRNFRVSGFELLLRKEASPDGGVGRRLGGRGCAVCQFLVRVAWPAIELRFDRA